MTLARLIIDGPGDGAWNMALDESLLETAALGGGACLRFYRWEASTLSLGYFQQHGQRRRHTPSLGCPLVRRPTGGGAIVHDRELTYSFASPIPCRTPLGLAKLYRAFHQSLVDVLSGWGVRAVLCGTPIRRPPHDEPFLCFDRRAEGDVLTAGGKIAGSAQRRRKCAVLQHGSILLSASPRAPEIPGIDELAGVAIQPDCLIARWMPRLSDSLGLDWALAAPEPTELARAELLRQNKFGNEKWTLQR